MTSLDQAFEVINELVTGEVAETVQALRYEVTQQDNTVSFWAPGSPWHLRADKVDGDRYFLSLYCRTSSADCPGDRSDLHDVLSVFAGAYLRAVAKLSCALLDVPHPVMPGSAEIYARYLVPVQPSALVSPDDAGRHSLGGLLFAFSHLQHMAFHLFIEKAQGEEASWEVPPAARFAEKVAAALRVDPDSDAVIYHRRTGLDIDYFRAAKARVVSVVRSEEIADAFALCLSSDPTPVPGIGGTLLLEGELRNFQSSRSLGTARRILKGLGDSPIGTVTLENTLVSVGGSHVVFMESPPERPSSSTNARGCDPGTSENGRGSSHPSASNGPRSSTPVASRS